MKNTMATSHLIENKEVNKVTIYLEAAKDSKSVNDKESPKPYFKKLWDSRPKKDGVREPSPLELWQNEARHTPVAPGALFIIPCIAISFTFIFSWPVGLTLFAFLFLFVYLPTRSYDKHNPRRILKKKEAAAITYRAFEEKLAEAIKENYGEELLLTFEDYFKTFPKDDVKKVPQNTELIRLRDHLAAGEIRRCAVTLVGAAEGVTHKVSILKDGSLLLFAYGESTSNTGKKVLTLKERVALAEMNKAELSKSNSLEDKGQFNDLLFKVVLQKN